MYNVYAPILSIFILKFLHVLQNVAIMITNLSQPDEKWKMCSLPGIVSYSSQSYAQWVIILSEGYHNFFASVFLEEIYEK